MAPDVNDNSAKAKTFFERAQKLAWSNSFDYAIEMYIEGIKLAPDNVELGHEKLRETAIIRQVKGGKKPSMVEKVKVLRGKTAIGKLINAEMLFAKDPDNLSYAEHILKAACQADLKNTVKWIADLMFEANSASRKPSFNIYLQLKEAYSKIELFDRALAALSRAYKMKPNDAELADEYKRLSAELTVSRGKYDQGGDFRKSIKDRESQEKMYAQDRVIKTEDYRITALNDARTEYERDTQLPKNIYNLADKLADMQDDTSVLEAVKLLEKAFEEKTDFSFKQRANEIRIKHTKRKIRKLKSLKPNSADSQLLKLNKALIAIEFEHYRLCVENYPTDAKYKYEYGLRLLKGEKYDGALPMFQEAQKDPRYRIHAMDKIGLCFFQKGWFTDAIDIFNRAIDEHELKDDKIAKELRYNLAGALVQDSQKEKALDIYRKIAQIDFAYRDVSERVDKIRKEINGQ